MKTDISKPNLKIIAIFAVIIMVLFIGGTYAWYTLTFDGQKTEKLHAGTLSVILDEELSKGFHLSNAYPMTDEEGMETKEYHFSIKNDGNIASNYIIRLSDLALAANQNRMSDDAVKFNLTRVKYNADKTKKENEINTKKLLSLIGSNPNRVLDVGTLQPNEYNDYTLRVWMDYNAGNDQQGTVFSAKIEVENTQIIE